MEAIIVIMIVALHKRNPNTNNSSDYPQSNHQSQHYDRNQFIWNRSGSAVNHNHYNTSNEKLTTTLF